MSEPTEPMADENTSSALELADLTSASSVPAAEPSLPTAPQQPVLETSTDLAVQATNVATDAPIVEMKQIPARVTTVTSMRQDDYDDDIVDVLPVQKEKVVPAIDEEEAKKKKKGRPEKSVGLFQMLTKFSTPMDRLLMLFGLVCAVATGCAQPVQTIFLGDILQALNQYNPACDQIPPPSIPYPCNSEYLSNQIKQGVIAYVITGCAVFVLNYLAILTWTATGERQSKRMREEYLASLLRQDIGWFDSKTTGDLINRIGSDVNLVRDGISERIASITIFASTFLCGFVIAFTRGWELALVTSCILPILGGAGVFIAKAVQFKAKGSQDEYGEAGAVANGALSNIRTVVAFGLESRMAEKYEGILERALKGGVKQSLISGVGLGIFGFCIFGAFGLAFYFGSWLVQWGRYDGGKVIGVFFAILIGAFSLSGMSPLITAVWTAQGAAYQIFETIDRKSPINYEDEGGQKPGKVEGEIEFRNVDFVYPTRLEVKILENFSLTIPKGKTVALVGASGSGKSTIVKLVERFYDPNAGQVLLDGIPIKDLNVRWLRQQMSIVGQEPVLFDVSIRENILLGLHVSRNTFSPQQLDDMVIDAAKKANAYDFIVKLEKGFDTVVGERGALLSGGQKQRVAIARAIISNPQILLLDESTSALDTHSERIVQAALDAASNGRTTIVVAHRLSTIKDADSIVVMARGRIVEQGTHQELIERGGVYAELVKAQELKQLNKQARLAIRRKSTAPITMQSAQSEPPAISSVAPNVPFGIGAPFLAEAQLSNAIHVAEHDREVAAFQVPVNEDASEDQEGTYEEDPESESDDDEGSNPSTAGDKGVVTKAGADGIAITVTADNQKTGKEADAKPIGRAKTAEEMRKAKEDEEAARTKKLQEKYAKQRAPWGRIAKANAPEWWLIIIGTAGTIVLGVIFPIYALVFGNILNVFRPGNPNLRSDADFFSAMFLVLGVANLIAAFLQTGSFGISGERMTMRLRAESFRALLRQEIAFFDEEENSAGSLVAKLSNEATEVKSLTGQLIGSILQIGVTILAGAIIACIHSWRLFLVIIACLPLLMLGSYLQFRAFSGTSGATKVKYEKASKVASEAIGQIRTVAPLTKEPTFLDMYKADIVEPHQYAVKSAFTSSLGSAYAQAFTFFLYALSFYMAGQLVLWGLSTAVDVQVAMFAVVFMAIPIGQASAFLPNVAKAKVAALDIFALLDRQSRINVESESGQKREPKGEVSASHVAFNYPTRPTVPVLKDTSLAALPGQTIACVGPSGAGKSTIISLVLRFYDILTGNLSVENVETRDWHLKSLRREMALVGQEPILFNTTIRENIAFGKPEDMGPATQAEIEAAAIQANIHNFVKKLPEGYETNVGESGLSLSGGQKQRVAIARALIRQPKLLLLDESTSALDSESERVVQNALDAASSGRTTITIAHRLSTIQNADNIFVFTDGKIIESGKHLELLAKEGVYAGLVKQQQLTTDPIPVKKE